jgi:hypothetical protein
MLLLLCFHFYGYRTSDGCCDLKPVVLVGGGTCPRGSPFVLLDIPRSRDIGGQTR